MESVGGIRQQDTRTGKDGKTYKARKPIRYTLAGEYDAAQADALEIECRAKIRLADEYDAAQERGKISQQGAHVVGDNMSTADRGFTPVADPAPLRS